MRLRVGVKSSQNPSWAFIAKSTQLLLLWDDSLFVTLIVPGTMCAWIPSHDKQKEWRPPEGWPDVNQNHCRALKKRADAAAGSVSASFQEEDFGSSCAASLCGQLGCCSLQGSEGE